MYGIFHTMQKKSFMLNADIDGVQPGDALILKSILLPDREEGWIDTFFVEQPNKFTYSKELSHTTLFLLRHIPKEGQPIVSPNRGAFFVVGQHNILNIKGSIYYMGALQKDGGFYSDSLVMCLSLMENAYSAELTDIYRHIDEGRKTQQQDSIKKYVNLYNSTTASDEMKELRKTIMEEANDSEYAVYLYLNSLHDITHQQLEERFQKYTPAVRNSYMGQRLGSMLKILQNIAVGNYPADFTVTNKQSKQIKLSDY